VVRTLIEKAPEKRFPSAGVQAGVLAAGERSLWWQEREPAAIAARRAAGGAAWRIQVRHDTRFLGREAELSLLDASRSAAGDGQGRFVLVEGEAGIGKTRLIEAASGQQVTVRCHPIVTRAIER
jgi:hypothetical protein